MIQSVVAFLFPQSRHRHSCQFCCSETRNLAINKNFIITVVLVGLFLVSPIASLTTIQANKMAPAATTAATKSGRIIAMHWFRKGLRLHDNPALTAALEQSPNQIYPVYVLDGDSYQLFRCTALRANFLVECLEDLDKNLRSLGSRLYVLSGDPTTVLPEKWEEWGITHMSFEEDETGEPYAAQRDESIVQKAQAAGIHLHTSCSETLYPLKEYVQKAKAGVPNSMTGFQKLFQTMPTMKQPLPAPTKEDFPQHMDNGDDKNNLSEIYLPPKKPTDLPWPRNIPRDQVEPLWGPADCKNLTPIVHGGETLARMALKDKLKNANWVATFEKPQTSCTSLEPSTTALSPYLSWGCLSPREVWVALDAAVARASTSRQSKPPVSLHGQMLWRVSFDSCFVLPPGLLGCPQ
jgi:cryptochrome